MLRTLAAVVSIKKGFPIAAAARHASLETCESARAFEDELRANHIETNTLQRAILAVGSAAASLLDPHRADAICCLAETTGEAALALMRQRMLDTPEGGAVLRERPRINSRTVDLDRLRRLPPETLGGAYSAFLASNGVTPDSRLPVLFIQDADLAYVMQRYRESHDLVHAALGMRTTMLGECAVKWVEAVQTRLPMCVGAAVFGAARLKPKHRRLYMEEYLPWALRTGARAECLFAVHWERRWEQPLEEFHKEMNIVKLVEGGGERGD